MKNLLIGIVLIFLISCKKDEKQIENVSEISPIVGTWKLVYGETREEDSVTVKDLSNSEFIKIINETHFAFVNQSKLDNESFYSGAGTYTLDGNKYVEQLDYIKFSDIRGHSFPFTVEFRGDSLIQFGLEEIKDANIKRHIVEKYIRIE
ncbi:hypothetical protein SAMN05660776_0655 [Salegentibacter holothuriorum]|uniref:Lipocalin-like domain-containing protein n=1 Tax=Salegentibacter holothuriorum TaxID=241145 RepID=A0A1T5AK68_9FLAO|nr:hypothetical protein [Salegentibacter holothuriorum]SKB35411.1 hypothetical protein SAMN05660776_0655 [Salegentibacter holothuriorum]